MSKLKIGRALGLRAKAEADARQEKYVIDSLAAPPPEKHVNRSARRAAAARKRKKSKAGGSRGK